MAYEDFADDRSLERAEVPASPLERTVGRLQDEMAQLDEYVALLESRLKSVRVPGGLATNDEAKKAASDDPSGSQIVMTLNGQVSRIRRCRQRINNLLETLEV